LTPYNGGAAVRIAASAKGKSFELQGELNEDIFDLPKYLINGVKVFIYLSVHLSIYLSASL